LEEIFAVPPTALQRGYNLRMLCKEGNELKDKLAEASSRFIDYAALNDESLVAERLIAEKLHTEQQNALSAFTRHVESCSTCGKESR
jgi:hypothetical protein